MARMSTTSLLPIPRPQRRRRRPGGPRRWTAADKAAHLAACATSGRTIAAYCADADVPLATFSLWRREARRVHHEVPMFARVELARAADPAGIWVVVREPGGRESLLTGLDAATAIQAWRLVLEREES